MSPESDLARKRISLSRKKILGELWRVCYKRLSGDAVFNSSLGLLSLTSLAPVTGVLRTIEAGQSFTARPILE